MSDDIRAKVEASSLGSAAAKAARESVTDEQAARVVARAGELRRREAIAEVFRAVPIGPFGPNALEVINRGGTTILNSSERADLADALLGSDVLAQIRAEARAEGAAGVRARIEGALANHPDACDKYDDEDVIKCGWKSAVIDVRAALTVEGSA